MVARSRTVAKSSQKSNILSITSARLMVHQSWLASTAAVLHLLWLGGHALITWRSTTKICNFLISDHRSLFFHYPFTDVNCLLVQPTICNTGNPQQSLGWIKRGLFQIDLLLLVFSMSGTQSLQADSNGINLGGFNYISFIVLISGGENALCVVFCCVALDP